MDRNKRLLRNTIIYFVGNISSKLLSFLLLPLYTTFLTTKDYGKVDLIFTYTAVIIPIITLQITFAGFRYLFDTEDAKKQKLIISNTMAVNLFGMGLFSLIYLIIWKVFHFEYGLLIILYLLLNLISSSFQQLTRGLRKNEVYTIVGVISTFVQLICNVLFIVGLGYRSTALILSPIVASIASIIYIIFKVKIYNYIDFNLVNKKDIQQMLKYSLPLVPDAVCWWLLLGFGRMVLSFTNGVDSVGVYAVANKFPSVVTMFYSIFNLAWQENSFSEYDKADRDSYYSSIYNKLLIFIIPVIIILIPFTKIISQVMIKQNFINAYLYIPILYIGALISILSTFYGSGFESAKETKGILVSTMYAMITNIVLNLLLTPKFSIWGTCIALVASNVILLISRINRSKKFYKINVTIKPVIILSIMTLIVFVLHYVNIQYIQLLSMLLGCAAFLYYNKGIILICNNILLKRLFKINK